MFVFRLKGEVKAITHEVRKDQAEMITIIQQGLESIKTVQVFGRQQMEEERLKQIKP